MEKCRTLVKSKLFLYFILAIACFYFACVSNNYDYDLYARLIVGEHFWANGTITYKDFLSYTPTHDWFDHEWGSSVVFYAFKYLFGPFGLILLHALTMFFVAYFIIKTQRIQYHAYPPSLLFMIGFLFVFQHLNPSIVRCHMFSFMFFAMLLYFLEKTRRYNSNILWLFPLLVVIWNNLHGGVVSGLGMIFIYMACEFLKGKTWRKYFYVLLVSTVLLIVNPYGQHYLSFLFSANTMNREYITEWWTVFAYRHVVYYYPSFIITLVTIALSLVTNLNKKKFDLTKFVALIVTAYLGITHVKLLSLTIVVIAALYYNEIIRLVSKVVIKKAEKLLTVLVLCTLFYIPFTHPEVPRVENNKFPYKEVEFLKVNGIKGNLLTSFGLGSFVSYKLYPANKIYMDGRYEEVYNDKEFANLMAYELLQPNWEDVFRLYPTEILMPEKHNPVYSQLQKHPEWEEVYTGSLCGVFLKKNRRNYTGKLKNPPQDLGYYQQTAFDNMGHFANPK